MVKGVKKEEDVASSQTATKTLFDPDVDYTQPTDERFNCYRLKDGNIIYLNDEQYVLMFSQYWENKKEGYLSSRCLISAKRGGLKLCSDKDCSTCPIFLNGKKNTSTISLDEMYSTYEFEVVDSSVSILEQLIKEEQAKIIRKAVFLLPDKVNRQIVLRWMYKNSTDVETARELGISRSAVKNRRIKAFKQLAMMLKEMI